MPVAITLTQEENEWLQNIITYFYNTITFLSNDKETVIYNSILSKLKTSDT